MENLKIALSNQFLGLAWKFAFRPNYSPQKMRKNLEAMNGCSAEKLSRKFPNALFDRVDLGGVPSEKIQANKNPNKTIFYLHGGGYFMGSINTYRRFALKIAHYCNASVFMPEYRLAPEFPFPAALDDSLTAYTELSKKVNQKELYIMGDSAGGGLGLGTLLALRDKGLQQPCGAICLSPSADFLAAGQSMTTNEKRDVCFGKEHLKHWLPWYLGKSDPKNPYLSPVYGNFDGICKLLILVGSDEVLLDDSLRVEQRAKEAGVAVKLHVEKKMQHDWCIGLPWLKQSKKALRDIQMFVEHQA